METKRSAGYGFGAFAGVFTPSILTIIGVVMYLRFGWVLGNLGLGRTLLLVTLCNSVTLLTGLSLSALATNREVQGGGAYYLVSRAFGAETGAAIGIPLFLSQAIGTAFYVAGFSESLVGALPAAAGWDPRLVGSATLVALAGVSVFSANLAVRVQYFIMAAIALSLVSFFAGGNPGAEVLAGSGAAAPPPGFWVVLAVFFPAVTGILSGVGMSGDLRNPGKAIPRGTLGAVLAGYAIYMAVPVALYFFAGDAPALRTDPMIFQKCSRWPALVLPGVWAACLSSALGSLLAAPRVLQAMSRDRLAPAFLGRGYGKGDDPRAAAALAFALAAGAVWAGGVNLLAPVLTMVNLVIYALLNLAAAIEEAIGSAAWRPTFRVPWTVAAAGFALCAAMMVLISPAASVAAMLLIGAIHWMMVRRRLRARWQDFRRGLLRSGTRTLVHRLDASPEDGRNWQPDILALGAASARREWLGTLAAALSRDRGLLTFASVVPEEGWSAERAEASGTAVRDWAARRGLEAFVRVHPAPDPWSGMRELVRAYGFGPLVPNTVLMGAPGDGETAEGIASVARLAVSLRRNLLLAAREKGDAAAGEDGQAEDLPRRIDLWWRGRGNNASFMLALACLLRRSRQWEGASLRLCHAAEPGEDPARAEEALCAFLREARVDAEVTVLPSAMAEGPGGASAAIRAASAEAGLVLLGLRPPLEGESDAAYGGYLLACRRGAASLPRTLYALAADGIDFRDVFA
ncbi:MAG: Na-K-Cl cotransporter [Kiritimatiellae bacterium]|nr:Na-K-Cl cotransporter [Kiritimatiellia bacterium]